MPDLNNGAVSHNSQDAKKSSSFIPPPLDGSMYLPEMVDHHLQYNANHTFALLTGEVNEDIIDVSNGEVARAIHRLATKFLDAVPDGPANAEKRPRTVAILANVDTLTYVTIVLALLRAGFEAFPLSNRNSAPALKHLLEATSASHLVGSFPKSHSLSSLEKTTQTVLDQLPHVRLLPIPKIADLYPRLISNPVKPYDSEEDARSTILLPQVRSLASYKRADSTWPCLVLHSSGSTKFPKPIRFTHSFTIGALSQASGPTVAGTICGAMIAPAFHAMGFFTIIGVPLTSGVISVMFKPAEPPIVPTPENSLAGMRQAKTAYAIVPPSFAEEWAKDPEAIQYLSSFENLWYAGGPMPQEAGNRLVDGGVKLGIVYGLTETGCLLRSTGKNRLAIHDWNYASVPPNVKVEFVPEDDKLYRLVAVGSERHPLAAYNVEGERKFDTNDLVEEHPEQKGYWRVLGRADDQIMMSNGEKTNPGPLESIIVNDPSVRAAVMFGRARTQVGVLIEPTNPVNIEDDAQVEAFRNQIWPTIEKANAFAPTHSRIFKEFILVIDSAQKPFQRTPKSTIARNVTLQAYEREINALYDAAEQPVKAEWAKPPSSWDEKNIRVFVERVVHGVLRGGDKEARVDNERDLFEQGCDSLQATYIRNAIHNAVRTAPRSTKQPGAGPASQVQQNMVFQHPSVRQLADHLVELMGSDPQGVLNGNPQAKERAVMLKMAEKYSSSLPMHQPRNAVISTPGGEVILLTGSTGTLGTYLLQNLLLDPKVSKVYALNRSSRKNSVAERQEEAFVDKGVDVGLLRSDKVILLDVDFGEPSLALQESLLEELRGTVTAIVHNSWRLDFNLSLQTFEPLLKGTRNLVEFALSSSRPTPPQIVFTSSIGTVSNWHDKRPVPEELIDDPGVGLGNGYGESKWVAERILLAAAEQRGVRVTIWRVGQLAGSTINGAWNTTDWVPIIVKSGNIIGKLPTRPGNVTWLPTDSAALAIIDSLHSSDFKGYRYLHLVHPKPIAWEDIFKRFSAELHVPLTPFEDWVSELENVQNDAGAIERIPAIRLLPFFRHGLRATAGKETTEAMGFAELETEKAVKVSTTLATLPAMGQDDVSKWMEYWRKHALFE